MDGAIIMTAAELRANLRSIQPELILTLAAFALMMLDVFGYVRSRTAKAWLAGLALAVTIAVSFGLMQDYLITFGGMVRSDDFANYFRILFALSGIITIWLSTRYVEYNRIGITEYYELILFSTVGMMVMAASGDFITFYIGLELMSISIYLMAGFMKQRLKSNEASFKYFLLGAFASAILLYGISILYGATGTTDFQLMHERLSARTGENRILILGLIMMTTGFGFKIAAVPFHMWTPDVYEGAPTPITAFMSVGPKLAAIAVIVRVYLASGVASMVDDWLPLVWVLSALSMIVGNTVAVVQTNLKRMLGYSSIAHAGYLLIGISAAGAALAAGHRDMADAAISGVMIYLLAYMLMNLGAFGVIVLLGDEDDPREHLEDYAGLMQRRPLIAVLMTILLLSLAGIPPTFGFIGKLEIFRMAVATGPANVVLAVLGMGTSVIAAFYYLRVVVYMFMREPEGEDLPVLLPHWDVFAVIFATVATLGLGLAPAFMLMVAQGAIPQ